MFRVEFIGLPGSGKTTIRRHIVKEMEEVYSNKQILTLEEAFYIVSKKRIDRMFRVLLRFLSKKYGIRLSRYLVNRSAMQFEYLNIFLSKYGAAFESFLSSPVYKYMHLSEKKHVISSFMETGSMIECLESNLTDDKIVFFDEGIVQKSFMLISKELNQINHFDKIEEYMFNIPIPDFIICLNVNLDTCYDRMINRTSGLTNRLNDDNEEVILNFLRLAEENINNIVNWLSIEYENRIIVVDNNDSVTDNAKIISGELKKIVD